MRAEAGLTLLEVVAAFSISVLAFASIHLTVGTAILGKLLTSSTVSKEQQGRQVVEWIADRVRQAGLRTSVATGTPARCQNGIVSQDPSYYPTTSSLSVTADVDNDGTPETHTFKLENFNGVPAITETVIECTGATSVKQPITSTTTVQALALQFDYYDVNGGVVYNLTSPTEIQKIRYVRVTVQVQASAGAHGPTTQTWKTNIALRSPACATNPTTNPPCN
jgi:hypothetical protein